jgi:hypothetical protein
VESTLCSEVRFGQAVSCLLYLATLRFDTPKQEAASLPNIVQD